MPEIIIPTLTEIGVFILQIIFAMILWQGYQLVKAKVENEKIKTERNKITLKMSVPKELENIEKPDSVKEKIEHLLQKSKTAKLKKKKLFGWKVPKIIKDKKG